MSETLISVIIPVYQSEKYLTPCLESLMAQDFSGRYEVILVDFGSRDHSPDICTAFEKRYPGIVTHLRSENNFGISASRNIGLLVAKGQYVTFVDSDDWVKKNYLSVLYRECEKTKAQIVTCGYYFSGKISVPSYCRVQKTMNGKDGLFALYRDCSLRYRTFCWGRMYQRKFLTDNRIVFDTDLLRFEDWLFIFQAFLSADKIRFIRKPLYHYRSHPDSAMSSLHPWDRTGTHIRVLKKTLATTITKNPKLAEQLFHKIPFPIRVQIRYDCSVDHQRTKTPTRILYRQALKDLRTIFSSKALSESK